MRYINKGQHLLAKNTVTLKSRVSFIKLKQEIENKDLVQTQLLTYARQKPNTKAFYFLRFNLYVYNLGNRDTARHKKWFLFSKRWMREVVGEPPVLFDSTLMHESEGQMRGYLFNKGYFNAEVHSSFKLKGKKATVEYTAIEGKRFLVDTLIFPSPTSPFTALMNSESRKTLVVRGAPVDNSELLQNESKRIATGLNNNGFYSFSYNDIYYDLDTTKGYDHVKLFVRYRTDTTTEQEKKYYIRKVKVYSDYNLSRDVSKLSPHDTLNQMYFYYDTVKVRSEVISNVIFVKHGDIYKKRNYDNTILRLSDLGVFKFISVQFSYVKGTDSMDCVIRLTPFKKDIIQLQVEGNNLQESVGVQGAGNSVGSVGKITFRDRNWLKRANIIDYNISAGTELPLLNSGQQDYTLGTQLQVTFPRLYLPLPRGKLKDTLNSKYPKTKISLSGNYEVREGLYDIGALNFSFGYEFSSKHHKINWNPFTLTVVKADVLGSTFQEELNNDPELNLSFETKAFISGGNISYTYSDQEVNQVKSFNYFKAYLETSGFTASAIQTLAPPSLPEGAGYSPIKVPIINAPFSDFVKINFEFKRYFESRNHKDRIFITRIFTGLGFHFLNSDSAMPYIEQYFAGGTSDIRGWNLRALGPGSYDIYADPNQPRQPFVNQTGDYKLEANVEYRFGIFGVLKGALFTDAGNVWNMKANPDLPGANFEINDFYKQIAIGSGFGLRLDFGYFVFRLDLAVPVRDPIVRTAGIDENGNDEHGLGSTWIFNSTAFQSANNFFKYIVVYNLAIGYPF